MKSGEILQVEGREVTVTPMQIAATNGAYQVFRGSGNKKTLVVEIPHEAVSYVIHEPTLVEVAGIIVD